MKKYMDPEEKLKIPAEEETEETEEEYDDDDNALERQQFEAGLEAEYAWADPIIDENGHPIKDR